MGDEFCGGVTSNYFAIFENVSCALKRVLRSIQARSFQLTRVTKRVYWGVRRVKSQRTK